MSRFVGRAPDRPMNTLTIGWLISMLQATTQNRNHGSNLEAIKSLRDTELGQLNTQFTMVASSLVTMIVAFGTLLYGRVTDSREIGSLSVTSGQMTTVTKTFSEPLLSTADGVMLAALIGAFVSAVVFLTLNRARGRRVDRAYANAVALYFFLSRNIR